MAYKDRKIMLCDFFSGKMVPRITDMKLESKEGIVFIEKFPFCCFAIIMKGIQDNQNYHLN